MKFSVILFLLCILCLLCSIITEAQTFQQVMPAPLNTSLGSPIQTADGGFLAVGSFRPATFDSAGAILTKFNSDLELEWTKRYKFLANDDFAGITALADGNYIIYGAARQDFTLICGGSMIKVAPNGDVIWSQVYDHVCDDRTIEVFENADNTLHAFIRYGVTGQATKVVKTSASGSILDKFIYLFGTDEVQIESVDQDANGDLFMTGTLVDSVSERQIFLIKYDGTNTLWSKKYTTGRTTHAALSVSVLQDGSVFIVGQAIEDGAAAEYNYLLLHIGTSGALLNSIELDFESIDLGAQVVQLVDGNIVVIGIASDFVEIKTIATKMDLTGNVIWSRVYGAESDNVSVGYPLELADNRLLFSGSRNGEDPYIVMADENGLTPCDVNDKSPVVSTPPIITSTINLGMETSPVMEGFLALYESTYTLDRTVVCTDSSILSGIQNPQDFDIKLYPNPAANYLIIDNKGGTQIPYSIYNQSGIQVGQGILQSGSNTIYLQALNPGLYFIKELGQNFAVIR